MRHPQWKRAHVVKAARLRRRLMDKELSKRLGVPLETVEKWAQSGRVRQ